jgi:hypothetical protein
VRGCVNRGVAGSVSAVDRVALCLYPSTAIALLTPPFPCLGPHLRLSGSVYHLSDPPTTSVPRPVNKRPSNRFVNEELVSLTTCPM